MTDIIQGSQEWFALRLGKVTASRVADIVAKTKSGWGASRANYAAELIAERLTGMPAASYTNAAMQWGTETEPLARSAYEFYGDCAVQQVAFIQHPVITMAGASPDGLVSVDGMVEIKCPNTSTHIDTLLGQEVPGKYLTQMQFQLACSGRRWVDFVSFDPRMPEAMRLFVKRVPRDDAVIANLEKEVIAFLSEVESRVLGLRQLYEKQEAA
jgi:putative phage-type endonuclease